MSSKKTDEQFQREAHHAAEALANPILKEILQDLEMESLEQLGQVDPFDTPKVAMAQADVKSVRKLYTRLINKVQALKNKQFADEKRQKSPMGETL